MTMLTTGLVDPNDVHDGANKSLAIARDVISVLKDKWGGADMEKIVAGLLMALTSNLMAIYNAPKPVSGSPDGHEIIDTWETVINDLIIKLVTAASIVKVRMHPGLGEGPHMLAKAMAVSGIRVHRSPESTSDPEDNAIDAQMAMDGINSAIYRAVSDVFKVREGSYFPSPTFDGSETRQ